MNMSELEKQLVVGAKVRIGKEYAASSGFTEGEVITLVNGSFEHENGLFTETVSSPAWWDESQRDFESIYHLWENDLSGFADCVVLL